MPEAIAAITEYQSICYDQDGKFKTLLEHSKRPTKSKRIRQPRKEALPIWR